MALEEGYSSGPQTRVSDLSARPQKRRIRYILSSEGHTLGSRLLYIAVCVVLTQLLAERHLFYGPHSWLPDALWQDQYPGWQHWSFHLGSMSWLEGLMVLEWLCAAYAAIWPGTARKCRVMVWLLHLSLFHRNPLQASGADQLLLALLFWGMLAPWAPRAARFGTAVQMACVYAVTVWLKAKDLSWVMGEALILILKDPAFSTTWGRHIAAQATPGLLTAASFSTLALEAAAPFFLLMPGLLKMRRMGLFLLMFFHGAIAALMGLWEFSLISIAGLILAWPQQPEWRRAVRSDPSLFARLLAVLALMATVSVNVPVLQNDVVKRATVAVGIIQGWSMFASAPRIKSSYTITCDRRPLLPEGEQSRRVRKYFEVAHRPGNTRVFTALTEWACRQGGCDVAQVLFTRSRYNQSDAVSETISHRHCHSH